MATPLTDSINALTQYANETTGKQDKTLSDAVGSLVEGYGGSDELYPVGTDIVTKYLGRNLSNGQGLFVHGTYDNEGVYTQTDNADDYGLCMIYIPIDPKYTYYKDPEGRLYALSFYDENFNFLKNSVYNNLTWKEIINVPENARYIRLATHSITNNWDIKILRMA